MDSARLDGRRAAMGGRTQERTDTIHVPASSRSEVDFVAQSIWVDAMPEHRPAIYLC